MSSNEVPLDASAINTPAPPSNAPLPRLGGGRAWGSLRAAVAANAVPGLDRYNRERAEKLNFAQLVWKAKWEEEQKIRRAQMDERQAAEMKAHGAFASIEYAPSNNEFYRAAMKKTAQVSSMLATCVYMLVGVFVGLIGTGMRLGIETTEAWRFALILDECDTNSTLPWNATTACTATLKKGLGQGGALVFFGVAAVLILISGSLVAFVAPAAAASGLPEVIAFLNGTFQGKIFQMKTLVVKFLACLLAVGSGLPAGPEAPMIHLGAMVGRQVSAHDSLIAAIGQRLPSVERLFLHFRNERDARDFVTAGTAAGVASAFGAPVGGVLFALEEISSSWSPSLTWKVFLTSMVAASVTCVIISAHAMAEDGLPFAGTIQRSSIEFYQPESSSNNVFVLLPAALIGLIAGVVAAGFTGANLFLIGLRKKYVMKATWRRVVEPILVMLVVVLASVGFSSVWGCTEAQRADPKVADRLVGLHCPPGSYNEVATLLYNAGGEVIKILWSRHDESGAGRDMFGAPSLLVLLGVYVPLACWTAGSIVPTGLIVPVILTGAAIGRLVGLLSVLLVTAVTHDAVPMADMDCDPRDPGMHEHGCYTGWNWVDPGAFAIYGSAAFFGGISRLHLTIPVLFMEISGQTRLLLPIMLACKVASVTADYLHPHSLFHAIIEFKGLTFLAAEAPPERTHELDSQMIKQILLGTPHTLASHDATIGSAAQLLEKDIASGRFSNDTTYPVVDAEDRFEGLISLVHLLALIEATLDGKELHHRPLETAEVVQRSKTKEMCISDAEGVISRCRSIQGAMEAKLALGPMINTSSYSVRDNMSILRAYTMFRSMGCRTMVVTDIGNKVVGMLTRHDLVDVCHPPHHVHDQAPAAPVTVASPAAGTGREALLPQ